jgi:acetyltransferase-like isoleucine patch superfamily enzyme
VKLRSAFLVSPVKSLYLSLRFRGQIVVLRGTRLRLDRGARIDVAPGGRLYLGQSHHVGAPLSLRIHANGRLTVKGTVRIFCGTQVVIAESAHLEIGDQTYINRSTWLTCWEHISIGARSAISWNCNIIDGNAHELVVGGRPKPRTRPLHIGDQVWIGAGATIVGASVGDGSVVGAGSVVAANVPAKALVSGNPARVTREDVSWNL